MDVSSNRLSNIYEFIIFFYKGKRYGTVRTIPLLSNNNFNNIFIFRFFIIIIITI